MTEKQFKVALECMNRDCMLISTGASSIWCRKNSVGICDDLLFITDVVKVSTKGVVRAVEEQGKRIVIDLNSVEYVIEQ